MLSFDRLKAFGILIKLVSDYIFSHDHNVTFTPIGLIENFRKHVTEHVSANDLINWSKQL